jgi:hypothetical protein
VVISSTWRTFGFMPFFDNLVPFGFFPSSLLLSVFGLLGTSYDTAVWPEAHWNGRKRCQSTVRVGEDIHSTVRMGWNATNGKHRAAALPCGWFPWWRRLLGSLSLSRPLNSQTETDCVFWNWKLHSVFKSFGQPNELNFFCKFYRSKM